MTSKIVTSKNYFSKFFGAGFIFRKVLIPLVTLTLYFILFSYIFPEGVNKVFAGKLWKIFLLLTIASGLGILTLNKFKKSITLKFKTSSEKLSFSDSILILLPLTPVIQFILSNQNILSIWQSFYVFSFFALFSILFIIIIPSIFNFIGSTKTIMIVGMAFTYTIISMSSFSNYFSWFEVGNLKIQLLIFGGIFLISWFLYDLSYKKLLYVLITIYFVSNTFSYAFNPINITASKGSSFTGNKLLTLTAQGKPLLTPNIYLLVYDAYVANETMLAFGIDNNNQETYLKSLGFKLYPSTYSAGAASITTMNRVLNASVDYYGSGRRAVSGDGVVQNILNKSGYESIGIFPSDYFFRGTSSKYDFSYPKNTSPTAKLLSTAILMGEFRFDLEFDKSPKKQFLATKQAIFKDTSKNSKFVYTHTNLPGHSQNSGSCLPNELDLFEKRLEQANFEMKSDIKTLLQSDPKAIIIVAGDHGPYLTKNCTKTTNKYDISKITRLDVQDRFGTFLAVRWPTKNFEKYDDITIIQDLFPSIFAYIFKDEGILDSMIKPETLDHQNITSGVAVKNGKIVGGVDNSKPLFSADK